MIRFESQQLDITPTRPCWQGGYVQRSEKYHTVHDPITATLFDIRIDDHEYIWISMDIAGVNQPLTDRVAEILNEHGCKIETNNIIYGATHTHSGPLLGSYYDREIDQDYFESVCQKLAQSIQSLHALPGIEVHMDYRCTLIDGLYSNRNDRNKFSDKLVHEFGFFDGDKLIGKIISLSHHCTILGPNFMDLSADLFGRLRALIQEETNCPVLMLQGNAGDMGNKQYRTRNDYEAVEAQAKNILDQMHKKVSDWQPLDIAFNYDRQFNHEVDFDIVVAPLIEKKAAFEQQLETETDFDTIKLLKTAISSYTRKIATGDQHVHKLMPYRCLNLGQLYVVTIPGELGSVLGERIKKVLREYAKVPLVWCYVNPQTLGYMIEKEAYEGFSQEANVTDYPAGVCDDYICDIIDHIKACENGEQS